MIVSRPWRGPRVLLELYSGAGGLSAEAGGFKALVGGWLGFHFREYPSIPSIATTIGTRTFFLQTSPVLSVFSDLQK